MAASRLGWCRRLLRRELLAPVALGQADRMLDREAVVKEQGVDLETDRALAVREDEEADLEAVVHRHG